MKGKRASFSQNFSNLGLVGRAEYRLADFQAADVAGYSRFMGDDEESTIAALGRARAVFREAVFSTNRRAAG